MKSIIEHLASLAEDLDKQGYAKYAKSLDAITEDVLDIKTAQYVGSQGYWVRNTRCWSNCYRQKRASNPQMPTQQIWSKCHEEYLKSINNDGTSWDKYAANTQDGLVKSASARATLDNKLSTLIESKMKDSNIMVAIADAFEDVKYSDFNRLIAASNKLLDMAENTKDLGLSIRLGNAAAMLSKEAQRAWYNPMQWVDKGIRGLGNAKDWASDQATNMRNNAIQRGVEDREQRAIRDLGQAGKWRNQLQDRGVTGPAAPSGQPGVNVSTNAPGQSPSNVPASLPSNGLPGGLVGPNNDAAKSKIIGPNNSGAGLNSPIGPNDGPDGQMYDSPLNTNGTPSGGPDGIEGGLDDALTPAPGAFDPQAVQNRIDEQVTNLARQQQMLQDQIEALAGIIGKDRAMKAISKAKAGLTGTGEPITHESAA